MRIFFVLIFSALFSLNALCLNKEHLKAAALIGLGEMLKVTSTENPDLIIMCKLFGTVCTIEGTTKLLDASFDYFIEQSLELQGDGPSVCCAAACIYTSNLLSNAIKMRGLSLSMLPALVVGFTSLNKSRAIFEKLNQRTEENLTLALHALIQRSSEYVFIGTCLPSLFSFGKELSDCYESIKEDEPCNWQLFY